MFRAVPIPALVPRVGRNACSEGDVMSEVRLTQLVPAGG